MEINVRIPVLTVRDEGCLRLFDQIDRMPRPESVKLCLTHLIRCGPMTEADSTLAELVYNERIERKAEVIQFVGALRKFLTANGKQICIRLSYNSNNIHGY